MIEEPNLNKGWIEVICGSMFSGKTEELLRRVRRAQIAGLSVQLFKPRLEDRYDAKSVVSHDRKTMDSIVIDHPKEILELIGDHKVVAIDEAQFLNSELADVCDALANDNKRVIVAGLDMDYTGTPFESMPSLLARAEYVTKLHAICVHCGSLAVYSMRTSKGTEQIELGAQENYSPVCRSCYQLTNR